MIKSRSIALLVGLMVSVLAGGCNDDPVFDVVPEISFVEITPTTVSQSTGTFKIYIHFQDGDGDIGVLNESDNTENLFVRDTRENIPDANRLETFIIPNLTPETRKPSIQGTMEIAIDNPPLLSNKYPPFQGPDTEEVSFEIYLIDRAGHHSNIITTAPITLTQ